MARVRGLSKFRFFTQSGTEIPSVSAAEMREIDRLAVEETGPNMFQMMENAGRNLALLAIELLGQKWQSAAFLVMAGGGGNGGGGICAARHLANRDLTVRLCLSEPGHMSEVAQWQRKVFQFAGGSEIAPAELVGQQPQIILDALIGYGLKSCPTRQAAEMIEWANKSGVPILALDIPSGLDATTGDSPGSVIRPQWTMTLALPKTGLLPGITGALYLADIGIPKETYKRLKLDYQAPFGNRYWIRLEQHLR
jgi:NAD(P)H-hydrate epimerase